MFVLSLPKYFHSDTLPNLIKQTTNPIVKNMIRVWFEVKKIQRKQVVCLSTLLFGEINVLHREEQMLYLDTRGLFLYLSHI